MEVSPLAGKPADSSILIDVPKVLAAYYSGRPDPSVSAQRVAFGTSEHRGCSLDNSFNEAHILAISQAICLYGKQQGIDGPLYIGFDTQALSEPAFKSALEVLAGNGIDVMIDAATRAARSKPLSLGGHFIPFRLPAALIEDGRHRRDHRHRAGMSWAKFWPRSSSPNSRTRPSPGSNRIVSTNSLIRRCGSLKETSR